MMNLTILLIFVALTIWTLLSKRPVASKLRTSISVVTMLLVLRLMLLQNGYVWAQYDWRLDQDVLGWRNDDVVSLNSRHWNAKITSPEYLVVGSSQVGAIFYQYARQDKHIDVLNMAGMGPLEMNLYIDHILAAKPKNIVLYMSEFDFAREPNFSGMNVAPEQGSRMLDLAEIVGQASDQNEARNSLNQLAMGEVLPEYKYAFIFKGFKSKYFSEKEVLKQRTASNTTDEQYLRQHLSNLAKFEQKHLAINFYMFEKFLGQIMKQDIGVVIVEGSYHPAAQSRKNDLLNDTVLTWISQKSTQFPEVVYIPKTSLPALDANDFKDGYHLSAEAGKAYAKNIFNHLERIN